MATKDTRAVGIENETKVFLDLIQDDMLLLHCPEKNGY